jgi:beta-glucosidase
VSAVLVAAVIVGNIYANRYAALISVYFDQATQKIEASGQTDANYYVSDFATEADRAAYLAKIGTEISEEGITLLTNDGVLPLASGAKISVFGQDAVDPVYGGIGAGQVDGVEMVTLKDSLVAAGCVLNPTLWDFYATGPGASFRKTVPDVYGQGAFAVNEVPQSVYTPAVAQSYADYSDAAIVVFGRSGGESGDLQFTPGTDGFAYLQLSQDERDLLAMVSANFDKVVVLVNAQNPLELGFL